MKSILVFLALMTIGFQAFAFDSISCRVTKCDPNPVTPASCQIKSFSFRFSGSDVTVGYTNVQGAEVAYATHGRGDQDAFAITVDLNDGATNLQAVIPVSCQSGQFNQNCTILSNGGNITVSENNNSITTYKANCQPN